MIARCRSQLKEQEETLAAIRKSQQLSREKRDEVNLASGVAFRSRTGIMSSVSSF